MSKLESLKIKWSQNKNTIFLHIKEYKFYMQVPFDDFNINNVRDELKEYCIHYLLYGLGYNQKGKNTVKEYPQFFLNNQKSLRKHDNNIGLCYSNGLDSGASLLLLPKDKTIPIFIHYNTKLSDTSLDDFICKRTDEHNINAVNCIKKIKDLDLPNIYKIESDFELVRHVLTNKKKMKGWNCSFGHILIPILLSDYFKLGYLSLGGVIESKFLKNGYHFKNIISKNRSESDTITAAKILKTINLELFYPVGGLSEVLTYKIVKNSILSDVCSSCIIGNKIKCLKCIKCFRKVGFSGKMLEISENIKNKLNKYPVKMATSTIYSCQKSGYSKSKIINSLKHVNLSFIEKYYPNYLYPDIDEIDLVPKIYKKVIKENLTKNNIEEMTESDINKLINIQDYFDNENYPKLKLYENNIIGESHSSPLSEKFLPIDFTKITNITKPMMIGKKVRIYLTNSRVMEGYINRIDSRGNINIDSAVEWKSEDGPETKRLIGYKKVAGIDVLMTGLQDNEFIQNKYLSDFYQIIGSENKEYKKFNILFNWETQFNHIIFPKLFTNRLDLNIEYISDSNNISNNNDEMYLVFHKWYSFNKCKSTLVDENIKNDIFSSFERENTIGHHDFKGKSYSFLSTNARNILINNQNSILILYTSFSSSEVRDFITNWNGIKNWFDYEGINLDKVRILGQNYKDITHPVIKNFDTQYYIYKSNKTYNLLGSGRHKNRFKIKKEKRIINLNRRHNIERFITAAFLNKFNNICLSYGFANGSILERGHNMKEKYSEFKSKDVDFSKMSSGKNQEYIKPYEEIIKKFDINMDEFYKKTPVHLDQTFLANGHLKWRDNPELDYLLDDSYFYITLMTNYELLTSPIQQVSEKVYKSIVYKMPFLLWSATGGILKYLKSLGFKTFDSIIDESYDDENKTYMERYSLFLNEMNKIIKMEDSEIENKYKSIIPILEYNYNLLVL